MVDNARLITYLERQRVRPLAISTSNILAYSADDVDTASSVESDSNVSDQIEHTPPPIRVQFLNSASQPTETCTKKGSGIRNDGVCGRRLADHEIGKNKRCSRCRDKDASAKRRSVWNIARGCGVRKHRLKREQSTREPTVCMSEICFPI